jgi:ABC-2 type transport system permease protein
MRKFFILLTKELRELITLQLILPLLVTMGMFVFIGNVIGKQQEKAKTPQEISVLDLDHTHTSSVVTDVLKQSNFTVRSLQGSKEEAIATAENSNSKALLIVPAGFQDGIRRGEQQSVQSYSFIRSFSLLSAQNYATLQSAIITINTYFSNQLISERLPVDPTIIKNPLIAEEHTVVGQKQAMISPQVILGFVSTQTTFIPIILFFVITFAAQMIATTIASEKENKTLETLLSLPIGRKQIVTAKMMAAGIVAAVSSIFYLIGFRSYINGLTGNSIGGDSAAAAARDLGLTFTPMSYVYLGTSLFVGILIALAIALILGSFAEDVKSVQGLITPLMLIVLVPYLLTMFLDFSSISQGARTAIYAIPFAHPFLAAPNLFLKNIPFVIYGILYQLVWFIVFVVIAGKIFTTDRIVTMKISFKKRGS